VTERPSAPPTPSKRARNRRLLWLLVPFLVGTGAAALGVALAPMLLSTSPLALIALSPLARHIVMVAPLADTMGLYAVAIPRLFIVDPFMYQLGRELGFTAVEKLRERFPGAEAKALFFERLFRRAGVVLVFLSSDPFVCLLAGASQMDARIFYVVDIIGSIVMITVWRKLGERYADTFAVLRQLIENNLGIATLVSVAVVALGFGRYFMKRRLDPPAADSE
jgi:membrane protein DedA with SNARE-associated domain